MIEFIKNGDILKSKCGAWVCPTNCVGVAGKGLALRFKQTFPKIFGLWKWDCLNGCVETGTVRFYAWQNPKWIICFPTKDHWQDPSEKSYISQGLKNLYRKIENWEIRSIAIPALGCGLGGLDWSVVRPMIERFCARLDDKIRVEVYEPLEESL